MNFTPARPALRRPFRRDRGRHERTARWFAVAAVLVGLVAAGAVAAAYFTSRGSGTGGAVVGSLHRPDGVSAVFPDGAVRTVRVGWHTVTAPDGGAVNGYYVVRFAGSTPSPACGSSPGALLPAATATCNDPGLAFGTYTYTVTVVFRTWTATSSPSGPVVVADTAPPSAVVTFPVANGLYDGTHWAAGCGSTICGTASDVGETSTGIAAVQVSIRRASTLAYWNGSAFASSTEVRLAAAGTTTWTFDFPATRFAADGTYTATAYAVDGAGNTSIGAAATFVVDRTAPAQVLALASAVGSYLGGTTLYWNPNATVIGGFKVVDTVTDATSGPLSATFPDIAASGWTHAAETVTSGSGAPPTVGYQSSTYTWAAGAANPADNTVTGRDAAGNVTTTTVHFVSDATAPTGGSVDASGLVGTGSRYATSTALSIAFAKGADNAGGSGVAASGAVLQRSRGTLASSGTADGTCSAYDTYATVATDPTSPYADTAPADRACYRYRYVAVDNVGNAVTYQSGDVKVQTTAPATLAPTFTFGSLSGSVTLSGTTVFFTQNASNGGGFTVTAAATDAFSGVTGYGFPAAPTGWTVTGSGASRTYSYPASTGDGKPAEGSQSVTATDNATLTASAAFVLDAAPRITAVTLANGGTVRKADAGDRLVVTFSKAIKASTFCSTWTSDATAQTLTGVTLVINDNSTNDYVTVSGTPCSGSTAFRFGFGATGGNYVKTGGSTATGSTIRWDPATLQLTLTLGAPTTTNLNTNVTPGAGTYLPTSGLTDLAGNPLPATAVTDPTVSSW